MKKFIFFLFLLLVLIFLSNKNQGFRPSKIFFPKDWTFTSNAVTPCQIHGKSFRYLSKGRQCFVFVSEDEKYVLKFLRFDKLQNPLWAQILNLFYDKHTTIESKNRKKSNWKNCFANAEDLPMDLGIISSQLSPGSGYVLLKDELGRSHKVFLENTRFFLQKKVTPLEIAIPQSKNPKKIIHVFLQSVIKRLNQNIVNKSQSCMENVGWIDNQIIEFDFGELFLQKKITDKKQQFLSFTEPMRKWLFNQMPELLTYFDMTRKEILNDIHE